MGVEICHGMGGQVKVIIFISLVQFVYFYSERKMTKITLIFDMIIFPGWRKPTGAVPSEALAFPPSHASIGVQRWRWRGGGWRRRSRQDGAGRGQDLRLLQRWNRRTLLHLCHLSQPPNLGIWRRRWGKKRSLWFWLYLNLFSFHFCLLYEKLYDKSFKIKGWVIIIIISYYERG